MMDLEYYYGNEADQYSFYRIPKALFTDKRFGSLSVEAKVLYGLLLDRMSLSIRNNWLDKDGRVYIIFTVVDIMATLGCAEQKTSRLLSELDNVKGVGLIERKRRGQGKPNVIYVKKFTDQQWAKLQFKEGETSNSKDVKTTNQEMPKSQANNTDKNNTDLNNIHQDEPETLFADSEDKPAKENQGMDKMDAYRRLIKKNISYDTLVHNYPYDQESINGFVELITEVCCSTRDTLRINQEEMAAEVVKSRLLKLDGGHIEYVLECLNQNTARVGNIRAYTLSALYNAPVTISQYYTNRVHHDMAKGMYDG